MHVSVMFKGEVKAVCVLQILIQKKHQLTIVLTRMAKSVMPQKANR